jgi:hypothetical protein
VYQTKSPFIIERAFCLINSKQCIDGLCLHVVNLPVMH